MEINNITCENNEIIDKDTILNLSLEHCKNYFKILYNYSEQSLMSKWKGKKILCNFVTSIGNKLRKETCSIKDEKKKS